MFQLKWKLFLLTSKILFALLIAFLHFHPPRRSNELPFPNGFLTNSSNMLQISYVERFPHRFHTNRHEPRAQRIWWDKYTPDDTRPDHIFCLLLDIVRKLWLLVTIRHLYNTTSYCKLYFLSTYMWSIGYI